MKGKSSISLILSILIICGSVFLAINGVGKNSTGGVKGINLGLDLEGGVSITYTTVKENPEKQEIDDTIFKLQQRIDEKGYTEGEVYREGSNRINVDIPGVSDANKVLEELGKPGNLEFKDTKGTIVISGKDVKTASVYENTSDLSSRYNVRLELNTEGKTKFAEATGNNIGKQISILYNSKELLAPVVETKITDGVAIISGLESIEAANDLATSIRIGALPLELKELRSNVVGAKMGQDAINTSLLAGFIGMCIIFALMLIVFRLPGLAASFALVLYSTLMIIIMSLANITLTLPGIAGIILSIGMAVDANVIIFARIKEELAMEKTLRASVKAGFKKALSAIIDGNVTTLIAAVILLIMGTGTIKGFAVTLALGIVVSMFTALVATRIIVTSMVGIGFNNKKLYGIQKETRIIRVIERRKIWFTVSLIIILAGLVKMPLNVSSIGTAFNYDIEFAGGTSTLVSVGEGKGYDSFEALEKDLGSIIKDATGLNPQLQNVKGKDQIIIKTATLNGDQRQKLDEALVKKYNITTDSIESESISATVSSEMRRDAILAILIATIAMLIYITIRFKDFRFGISAIAALVHDVLIVLTVYSVLNIPVNNSFIAAMLTIVGYSINDTIIVFDRIRENQIHMKKGDYLSVANRSISQTLARSIYTSMTTFVMVLVLYIVGVDAIRDFALPLMVGILAGTFSSIFIASPLWYMFNNKRKSA